MDISEARSLVTVADCWRRLFPETAPDNKTGSFKSPFREESNPSFSICHDGQGWNDFTTGDKGDQVGFIMEATGCDRKEAVAKLIEFAGGKPSTPTTTRKALAPKKRHDETAERREKRESWPVIFEGEQRHCEDVARIRGIGWEATVAASLEGHLRFARWRGIPSWLITSYETWIDGKPVFVEARRMDGRPYVINGRERKSDTWPGSIKIAVGAENLKAPGQSVALVEGLPDFITAYHYIERENAFGRVVPVCVPGSFPIPDSQIGLLAGRKVRIFMHSDANKAGEKTALGWIKQLTREDCEAEVYACRGDLNDMAKAKHTSPLMDF